MRMTGCSTTVIGVAAGALLWACAGGMWAGVARAEGEAPPSVDPEQALSAMNSDDYATRERATKALAGDLSVSEEDITKLMKRPDLTPEQSQRLLEVVRERFMSTPRGAIGIRYDRTAHPPRVAAVFPNFPAAKDGLLRAGDQIVSIEGRSLEDHVEVMQEETFSRDPGDTLHLHIRREVKEGGEAKPGEGADQTERAEQAGGPAGATEELDIAVKLGSTMDFPDNSVLDPAALQRALAVRLARMGAGAPTSETIEPRVEPGKWDQGTAPRLLRQWSRVLSGPLESEAEASIINYGGVAMTPENARLIRQLDALRQGGNGANLANGLKVHMEAVNLPGGGRVEVQRIDVPQEMKAKNEARLRQIRAQQLAIQRQRMALQLAEQRRKQRPEETTPGTPDPVEEANRLATQIGELERRIAEQTRMLRSAGADDPNVRRLTQETIDDLRGKMAALRARLQDAMSGIAGDSADASLEGE